MYLIVIPLYIYKFPPNLEFISFLSLNTLSEKLQVTIIPGNFVAKPNSIFYWLIVFGKCLSLVKT